jgi:hypothetical protein
MSEIGQVLIVFDASGSNSGSGSSGSGSGSGNLTVAQWRSVAVDMDVAGAFE